MKYLIISILTALCVQLHSQTASEIFIRMPDNLITELESAWRKDLIDLYKSGKEATLENSLQGKSTLLTLNDDYLKLQLTARVTLEMRRLPLINNTYIICLVTTVYAPVPDSRVSFYTTDWQPLPAANLLTGTGKSWFIKEDADQNSQKYIDAMAVMDIDLILYSLSPDNDNLKAEYMTPKYLNAEDSLTVSGLLKDKPRIFKWNLGRFE